MGSILSLIKVLHFFGIFLGGGSAFGAAVIGMTGPKAPVEHHETLRSMALMFKRISHAALGLLILTGFILAVSTGAFSTGGVWFWIKLAVLLVLIYGIIQAGKFGAKALNGEPEAGETAEKFGKMNMVALLIILVAAVFAFG